MIQCPRCGALANEDAARCATCQTDLSSELAVIVADEAPVAMRRTSHRTWMLVGVVLVAAVGAVTFAAARTPGPRPPDRAPRVSALPQTIAFTSRTRGFGLVGTCLNVGDTSCALTLAVTSDRGRSWHVSPGGHLGVVGRGSPRIAASGRDVWVYGIKLTLVSHDGGLTFASEDFGGPVTSIVIGAHTVWALVQRCSPCSTVIAAIDRSGRRWHRLVTQPPIPDDPDVELVRVGASPPLVLDGFGGHTGPWLWHSGDGGRTWTPGNLPAPCGAGAAVRRMAATDPRHLWVACEDAALTERPPTRRVFRSADGGTTWVMVAAFTDIPPGSTINLAGSINRLYVTSPSQVWLTATNGSWSSIDGGKSWQKMTAVSPGSHVSEPMFVRELFFLDSRHGWALGPDPLYETTDGRHWRAVLSCVPDFPTTCVE